MQRAPALAAARGSPPGAWLSLAAALALGAAFTVPLEHTWAWPLSLLCLIALLMLLRDASPRRAAVLGWLFSAAWIAGCTWWLFISLHRYGGLPAPLAVLAVALLALALGLYMALVSYVFARLRSVRHPWRDALMFGLLWWLAEWARARIFTGFPWGASGYTQVDSPLAGLAPWVGVYGIGAVLAFLAAALVLMQGAWQRRAGLLTLVLAVPWVGSFFTPSFTRATHTISVSLIQTGISQDEKFDARRMPRHVYQLADSLRNSTSTLVLAPETAIPVLPSELGPDGFKPFDTPFVDAQGNPWNPQRGALIGLPLGSFDAGYTNSVAGFGGTRLADNMRYRYNKHHLVPFGEFIPFGFRWFVEMMNIPLGDFERGPVGAASFTVAGERIGPNICYEDLFGEELAQRYGAGGDAPTMHANVSNIAWFGDTVAIDHHLNISRMRAMELQRPMLRATNTGATAVIDHEGNVTASLPRLTRAVLHSEVTGREGLTPYVRLMVMSGGLGPLALLAAAMVAMLALSRRDFRAPRNGI